MGEAGGYPGHPRAPSSLTFSGTSLPFVLPLQSWPITFQPQANTAPFEVSARLWYKPPRPR